MGVYMQESKEIRVMREAEENEANTCSEGAPAIVIVVVNCCSKLHYVHSRSLSEVDVVCRHVRPLENGNGVDFGARGCDARTGLPRKWMLLLFVLLVLMLTKQNKTH